MALRVVKANITVATAGTPVALSSTEVGVTSVIIQADDNNTDKVYVADLTVTSADFFLNPSSIVTIEGDQIRGINECFFLNDIFIDADTDGNKVHILFLRRRK